jgi:asparagine synthase (glutamine-hydrolysing)
MCGIAGFMLAQPALVRADIEARLWAMIGTLRHRGPDDEGVWIDGAAASESYRPAA